MRLDLHERLRRPRNDLPERAGCQNVDPTLQHFWRRRCVYIPYRHQFETPYDTDNHAVGEYDNATAGGTDAEVVL